jgi:hypothetical protein
MLDTVTRIYFQLYKTDIKHNIILRPLFHQKLKQILFKENKTKKKQKNKNQKTAG